MRQPRSFDRNNMFGQKTTRSVTLSRDEDNVLLNDDLPEAVSTAAAMLAQSLAHHFDLSGEDASLTLTFHVSASGNAGDLWLSFDEEDEEDED